jgi:hypothetical protein
MTQDECLALPSHFTHLGVCYPASSAIIQLSNPQNPPPVTFTVTDPKPVAAPEISTVEPAPIALFVGAMLAILAYKRARRGTNLS